MIDCTRLPKPSESKISDSCTDSPFQKAETDASQCLVIRMVLIAQVLTVRESINQAKCRLAEHCTLVSTVCNKNVYDR